MTTHPFLYDKLGLQVVSSLNCSWRVLQVSLEKKLLDWAASRLDRFR